MPWMLAATAISAGASYLSSRQAANATADAAKASQIDIDKLDEQTRRIAKQNALDSAALEKQLTPEVPELRTAANKSVIDSLNDPNGENYRKLLESKLGSELDTPLLREAIAKARSNLSLGGNLSQDVQNAVTRRGLATAGGVAGGSNLGLGRDVVARDLGLTSQQIEQQRLQTALGAGQQEQSLATDNANTLLNRVSLLQQINSQRQNFGLAAAGYGQSIQQPIVGLDPTAIANAVSGNATNKSAALANQANIYGAQGQGFLQAGGQFAGLYGLSQMNKTPTTPTYPVGNSLF